MIGNYVALIKRELWEHRSIFVTPIAIASIVTLGTLTALVFVGEFREELNLAIFGAQNVAGETERKAVLTGLFIGSSWLFLLGLGVLTVFYALDSLYAERKDNPVLAFAAGNGRGNRDIQVVHSAVCDTGDCHDRHHGNASR